MGGPAALGGFKSLKSKWITEFERQKQFKSESAPEASAATTVHCSAPQSPLHSTQNKDSKPLAPKNEVSKAFNPKKAHLQDDRAVSRSAGGAGPSKPPLPARPAGSGRLQPGDQAQHKSVLKHKRDAEANQTSGSSTDTRKLPKKMRVTEGDAAPRASGPPSSLKGSTDPRRAQPGNTPRVSNQAPSSAQQSKGADRGSREKQPSQQNQQRHGAEQRHRASDKDRPNGQRAGGDKAAGHSLDPAQSTTPAGPSAQPDPEPRTKHKARDAPAKRGEAQTRPYARVKEEGGEHKASTGSAGAKPPLSAAPCASGSVPQVKEEEGIPPTPVELLPEGATSASPLGALDLTAFLDRQELWGAIKVAFGGKLPKGALGPQAMRLVYKDADGDWLLLQSDENWDAFLATARKIMVTYK